VEGTLRDGLLSGDDEFYEFGEVGEWWGLVLCQLC
jgi:hypothetical protein